MLLNLGTLKKHSVASSWAKKGIGTSELQGTIPCFILLAMYTLMYLKYFTPKESLASCHRCQVGWNALVADMWPIIFGPERDCG